MKVCCIRSIEEAFIAIDLGADAVGLVSQMPSGPGVISEEAIATIAAAVPTHVDTFLLTSQTEPARIIEQHKRCATTTIQLCDALPLAAYPELRAALPTTRLVQVLHVEGAASLKEAMRLGDLVDAILLDSGRPNGAVKVLGGTGRRHDWSVSSGIVEASPVPVWLAGGLRASNVGLAISAVRPHGVDLCSGVRSGGDLDTDLLRGFMAAVAGHAN